MGHCEDRSSYKTESRFSSYGKNRMTDVTKNLEKERLSHLWFT